MNGYYSVFGIRKFFMNEYIRNSVKFTIRCNSGDELHKMKIVTIDHDDSIINGLEIVRSNNSNL